MNKMNIKILLKIFVFLILALSCSDTNDDQIEPVVYSDSIDFYDENNMSDDFVFVVENSSTNSYLINKQGFKVWEWNFDTNSGNDLEILPNGDLVGIFKSTDPFIDFGGWGGIVKILNKNNATLWEYEFSDENTISHHDVEMLPNGNILVMIWERIANEVAVGNGVDVQTDIFTEKIVEINPSNNEIIWEWRSWDHIIQDKYESLPNYGNLNANPGKININYTVDNPPGGNFFEGGDIMHANGLDYDPINDIIFLSVNYFDEIWVIDHSTTIQESQSDTGGNYNKGGDLIYRFGNPNTYDSLGEKLFDKNHFPNLLEDGVEGEGNVLVYVNGNSSGQSIVYELELPNQLNLNSNSNNEPTIRWSYTNDELFATKLSGAVRLSNGNTLITESDYGLWEITPDGEIAWKYNKGEAANIWRAYHYSVNGQVSESLGLIQD